MADRKWILGLMLAVGCSEPASTSSKPGAGLTEVASALVDRGDPVSREPASVAVAGCDGLQSKPTCWRDPESRRPVVLWLEGDWSAEGVVVELDGDPLAEDRARIEADADGLWIELLDRELRGRLRLRVGDRRPFELELAELSPAYVAALSLLMSLLMSDRSEEARESIEGAGAELDELEAHLLDCAFARAVELREPAQGPAVFERVQARAARVDELGCLAQVALGVGLGLVSVNELAAAEAMIEAGRRRQELDLAARITAEYVAGGLADRSGSIGEGLEAHARAARWAERAGLTFVHGSALVESGVLLARLGRVTEAEQLAREAVRAVGDHPIRLEIQFQWAWIDIVRQRHDPASADPSPLLRSLLDELDEFDPALTHRILATRLNLAVALQQAGDVEGAARELAAIDRTQLDARQQLYYELMGFRVALARGKLRHAREQLERAELLAEIIHDREFGLELLDARADLELRDGRRDRAREAYEQAELLAEQLVRQIPAGAGRSSFATTLTPSRARYVELLLASEEPEAALCTILAARARSWRALAAGLDPLGSDPERRSEYAARLADYHRLRRALDEREESSWTLSKQQAARAAVGEARTRRDLDEQLAAALAMLEHDPPEWRCADLRSNEPSKALLTSYPSADGQGRWFLLDRAGEVRATRVSGSGAAATAEALDEFGAEGGFEGVELLTIVPLGDQLAVDLHTLDFVRRTNLQVHYGFGLGRASAGASVQTGVAAVLASGENLVHVHDEAEQVGARLRGAGWVVESSWDPSVEAQPQLLHYAGHATHAGLNGWTSALTLPDGRALSSPELLVGRRAPSFVVLGACEAGTSDVGTIDGGMNLAAAFLLAGARAVLAADKLVDDEVARDFAVALHAALAEHAALDERALGEVLARVQRADPRFDDWRLWVP